MVIIRRASASNGGNAANGFSQIESTFNDLNDGSELNEIAFVLNPQGTKWLPGSLGGNYYPKGVYKWTGTDWIANNDLIAEELANLIANPSTPEIYTSENHVYDKDATHIYAAWERIDDTGYLAEKINILTNTVQTNTGSLPIPADIKLLTYS